jgi:hypothetical protein
MSITPEICTHCGVPAGYKEELEKSRKLIEKIHCWFLEHDANLEIHNGSVILFKEREKYSDWLSEWL